MGKYKDVDIVWKRIKEGDYTIEIYRYHGNGD